MKDMLIFDTTDANTIADSDKVLAGLISSDGSTLITDTLVSGKQGVDVFVINSDLDVNLQAGDGTDITQTGGALDVNIASGNLALSSEFDEDSAHTSGDKGVHTLAVRQDTLAASTSADGDYASFKVDSVGSLYVKATDTDALLTTIDSVLDGIAVEQLDQGTTLDAIATDVAAIETELLDQGTTLDAISATLVDLGKAEDSAHVSGDTGIMSLAVRNDTLGSLVSADGDYTPLQTNSNGELYVTIGSEIDVDDTANTAIANAVETLDVASTSQDVVASPLADRKYLYVYNNANRRMFVGGTGVTVANGFPVAPRSYLELRAGSAIDVEYVSPLAGHEIRTLEMS